MSNAEVSDIHNHNRGDRSCFGSHDRLLIVTCDRKSRSTAMLLLGKRQLALTSSVLWMASLRPMLITTLDSISLTTDILEVRRNPRSLHLRMQEAATQFVLSPTDKTLCLMFEC